MFSAPTSTMQFLAAPVESSVPRSFTEPERLLDSARQALDQALAQADESNDRKQLVALMRTSRHLNRLCTELTHATDPAAQAALAATAARFAEKAHSGFHLLTEEVAT